MYSRVKPRDIILDMVQLRASLVPFCYKVKNVCMEC